MLRKFRSHARKVVLKYFSRGRYKRAHFVVVFICFYKVIGNVKIHCYPLFLPSLHLCELSWIKTSIHESAREWMSGWTLLGFWMITISLLLLLIQHWADDTLSTLFWFSLCILSHFILSTFVLPSFFINVSNIVPFVLVLLLSFATSYFINNESNITSAQWLFLPLPSTHYLVHRPVKTTDISSISVSLKVLLALCSTMGQQGGTPGVLAGDTSPVQGEHEPVLIPVLFCGRLTLLNRHRVNQHISLYPSRCSTVQARVIIIYLCVCVVCAVALWAAWMCKL